VAAYTPVRLGQAQPGTGNTTVYTVPGGRSCIVKELVVCNVTNGQVALSASLCTTGLTPGDTNRVIKDAIIDPKATVIFTFDQVLPAGGFVSVTASAAASLTVTASGVEFV